MKKNRSGFAWGIILILLGAMFLAKELFPVLIMFLNGHLSLLELVWFSCSWLSLPAQAVWQFREASLAAWVVFFTTRT